MNIGCIKCRDRKDNNLYSLFDILTLELIQSKGNPKHKSNWLEFCWRFYIACNCRFGFGNMTEVEIKTKDERKLVEKVCCFCKSAIFMRNDAFLVIFLRSFL